MVFRYGFFYFILVTLSKDLAQDAKRWRRLAAQIEKAAQVSQTKKLGCETAIIDRVDKKFGVIAHKVVRSQPEQPQDGKGWLGEIQP